MRKNEFGVWEPEPGPRLQDLSVMQTLPGPAMYLIFLASCAGWTNSASKCCKKAQR